MRGVRLRSIVPIVAVVGCAAAAQAMGAGARSVRAEWPKVADEPYAPSPSSARVVTLGYREVATDLLWIRALAYVGQGEATSKGVRQLVAAMVALDPRFEEVLSWGALAMQPLGAKLTNEDYFAVLAILERGMTEFPDNFRLPLRAGEIYARGLQSDDPAQVRAWKAEGAMLLARAVRLPDAPRGLGTYVAHLETELGQRDKAIRDLRELITYTSDAKTRNKLIAKLAKLTSSRTEAISYELDVERLRFDQAWHRDRPELPPSMYVVLGPPLPPAFDLAALAADLDEVVEPITPLPGLADDVGELPPDAR